MLLSFTESYKCYWEEIHGSYVVQALAQSTANCPRKKNFFFMYAILYPILLYRKINLKQKFKASSRMKILMCQKTEFFI